MRSTAEVVIIGAGIMGCAIAHALAERGITDVVVLERDQIGRGATADRLGGTGAGAPRAALVAAGTSGQIAKVQFSIGPIG